MASLRTASSAGAATTTEGEDGSVPATFNYLSLERVRAMLEARMKAAEAGGAASGSAAAPTASTGQSADVTQPETVRVRDARRFAERLNVRGDGVALVETHDGKPALPRGLSVKPGGMRNGDVESRRAWEATRTSLVPAARQVLGGFPRDDKSCFALLPLFRTNAGANANADKTEQHTLGSKPHDIVHNDYDSSFAEFLRGLSPTQLRQFLIADRSRFPTDEDLATFVRAAKRVVVLQFWGNYQEPGTVVESHPLALCMPRSVKQEDLVPIPLPEYNGIAVGNGEFRIALVMPNRVSEHEWVYFPKLASHELLCWVGYDSAAKPFTPPFHSAFHLPEEKAMGARLLPRESFEARVVCFLNEDEAEKLGPLFPAVSQRQATKTRANSSKM